MALGAPTVSIDVATAQMREAARVGFTAFCSRFVGSVEDGIALPERLRTVAGEDFVLALDGCRRHRTNDAQRIGRALDAHDFFWFIRPLDTPEPEAMRSLAARLDTPIVDGAAGPDAFAHAAHLVASQSVDVLHIDVRRCGGITGALKLARTAEAFGIHCAFEPDDSCGGRAIAHLLGAIRNAPFCLIDAHTPNIAAAEGLHVPSLAGL
jgi:L-alanine-DL-glutamate epimerase-like enolase superfamily enzyme